MARDLRRKAGLTALYLGVFAIIWFSVPKAQPPLRTLLVIGSVAAGLTAVTGGVVAFRARNSDPTSGASADDWRYLRIVGLEFAGAALGALLFALAGWSTFIPVLVSAVVGVHFVALAPVLRDPLLPRLGAAVCLVALAGLVAGLFSSALVGKIVGTGTGVLLLGYADMALMRVGVTRARGR